jgi:hypothetical protein
MLAIEGTGFFPAFKSLVAAGDFTNKSLATLLALGGATYYAYNEVAFLALGKVRFLHTSINRCKRCRKNCNFFMFFDFHNLFLKLSLLPSRFAHLYKISR